MEILTTHRLRVRQIQPSDASVLMSILGDPTVMKYFGAVFDERGVQLWIENVRREYPFRTGLWLAEHRQTGEGLGIVGVSAIELEGTAELELHAAFAKAAWGKGYAVEAAKACVAYGFRTKKVRRIVGVIRVDNRATRKAAERVGLSYSHEVVENGAPYAIYTYARERLPHPHPNASHVA